MQCKSCGSKWESKTQVESCPFCGQSLQIVKNPEEVSISDVIEHIISIRGVEVLKNSKIITSYVMDLVRGHEHEKRLFRVLCNYDIFSGAYKIVITSDPMQRDIIIKRQYKILIDEAFLPEKIAAEALNIVLRGIGVKEFEHKNNISPISYTISTPTKTSSIDKEKKTQTTIKTSNIPPTPMKTSDSSAIDTFEKYFKALEDYYVKRGKQPLDETQIRHFLGINSLDRVWGITVSDVQKDLKDVYAKYSSVKSTKVEPALSRFISNKSLFTPNKRLSTYKAYMDELEQVFIRNGKSMLTRSQVNDFIEAYWLRKNFGITAQEVETDLREIMRKY